MRQRTAYRDDRGRFITSGFQRSGRAAREAGVDRATVRAALWPTLGYSLPHILAVALTVFVLARCVAMLQGDAWRPWLLVLPVVLIVATCLALTPWFAPRYFALHRRGWLSMGLCPACGYPISEFEPEADGCRTCIECGSAWKLGDSVGGSTPGSGAGQG